MKLSIVTTLYRSAATVEEFYRRVLSAAEMISDNIEFVLVNDGSPDDSIDRALALYRADPRVVVVDLARNFGHHRAMMTGLTHASGDLVFLIDSDLEETPEDLIQFHRHMCVTNCDVVYGVQEKRRGGLIERIGGKLYYFLLDILSETPPAQNLLTSRLMTRDYVRWLVRHKDREFVISNLWTLTGFRQEPLKVEKLSSSPTSYSLGKRIELAVRHITTSSNKLLYFVLYAGILIFGISIMVILFYLGRFLISGVGVDGFTSQIISIWLLGGLITLILGIIAIYLGHILSETKRRPFTVVRRVHRSEETT